MYHGLVITMLYLVLNLGEEEVEVLGQVEGVVLGPPDDTQVEDVVDGLKDGLLLTPSRPGGGRLKKGHQQVQHLGEQAIVQIHTYMGLDINCDKLDELVILWGY